MNLQTIKCEECKIDFERTVSEINRSKRLRRFSFCSRSCSVAFGNRITPRGTTEHLLKGSLADDLSPFRWYVARARYRSSSNANRQQKGPSNLTPEYLKKLWDEQTGVCPLTGWKMVLPFSSQGWKESNSPDRASLDRIDCSKGYVEDNVRFICVIANYARNAFNDVELQEFCKAVAEKTIVASGPSCATIAT